MCPCIWWCVVTLALFARAGFLKGKLHLDPMWFEPYAVTLHLIQFVASALPVVCEFVQMHQFMPMLMEKFNQYGEKKN